MKKFRVWCKDFNEWEKDICLLALNGDVIHRNQNGYHQYPKKDTHIVEFAIGKQDKNKKDAYEGDIIKYSYLETIGGTSDLKMEGIHKTITGTIYWCKCDFAFKVNFEDEEIKFFFTEVQNNFEIVGNIHEGLFAEMLINQVGKEEGESIDKDILKIIKKFNGGVKK